MADNTDLNLQDLDTLAGQGGGGAPPRRKTKSKVLPILIGVILLFFLAAFAWIKFGMQNRAIEMVNQAEVGRKAAQVTNEETSTDSEVYRQANREEEFEKAERAEREGSSTIPRLMEDEEIPLAQEIPPAPPPPPPPPPQPVIETPPPPPAVEYSGPQAQLDISRWMEYSRYAPGTLVATQIPRREKDIPEAGRQAQSPASQEVDGKKYPELEVTPGEILYAIMEIGANSDQPGTPIVARVAAGKWSGAKFIGGFRRMDEKLVLQFNQAVITDRRTGKAKTYSVSGYAVDPDTSQPGVASSVDTHFLMRWGGLIATSFLEGLGLAKERSGSTFYYGNDNNPAQIINDYDPAEEAWIAAGKVGEKLADRFEDNFSMPPTVKINPGQPIGILLL